MPTPLGPINQPSPLGRQAYAVGSTWCLPNVAARRSCSARAATCSTSATAPPAAAAAAAAAHTGLQVYPDGYVHEWTTSMHVSFRRRAPGLPLTICKNRFRSRMKKIKCIDLTRD